MSRCVVIESPLRGDVARNTRYADACMLDSLRRSEAPMLGHLLYPRVLDDALDADRRTGIDAHCAWIARADVVVVYTDLGITPGMSEAVKLANQYAVLVEYRALGVGWEQLLATSSATASFR